MPSKKLRHGRIVDLVKKHAVESQEQLSAQLRGAGIRVTQSTLSRDIRELGLVKIRGIYKLPQEAGGSPSPDTLRRSFQQLVIQARVSGNILMVKTAPGDGHSMGVILDAAQWPEVLGSVAGDDTVFVLLRSSRLGGKVLKRIGEFLA
jgi:transcriptional regulator of arginine metabolism